MRYAHTMLRIGSVDEALEFYCGKLGLRETRRITSERHRLTSVFVAAPADLERALASQSPELELIYYWESKEDAGAGSGHIAFRVEDLYDTCQSLMDKGVTINRPPYDGIMAFFKSPEGVSIQLLQDGAPLPPAEPWKSMPSVGSW